MTLHVESGSSLEAVTTCKLLQHCPIVRCVVTSDMTDLHVNNCYVMVGTLSRLGIVLPIGNVALKVLVLGSK